MREWIPAYFLWLSDGVKGFTTGLISWTRAQAIDWLNALMGWEDWSKATVDWWLSWAPWPISILTDWFGSWVKDSVIYPIFHVARWPFQYIRDRIDQEWDNNVHDYKPSLEIALAFTRTGDAVLSTYDTLVGYADAVGTTVHNAMVGAVVSLWQGLNALTADLQVWQGYIRDTLYPWINAIVGNLTVVRQDLDRARNDLYAILADPATWVWNSIYPGLAERVRLWLLDIWE